MRHGRADVGRHLTYAAPMRRLLVGALLALSAVLATASAATASEAMGTARAGRYYTTISCPAAAAGDRFQKVVGHGTGMISLQQAKRRLPELRRESSRYAKPLNNFARRAFNPPAPWPSSVDRLVNRFATLITRFGDLLRRMGNARTAPEWIRLLNQAGRIKFGDLGAQIKARLDLPPPGEGC